MCHFFLKSMQVNTCKKESFMVYFVATIYFDESKDKGAYLQYIQRVKPIVD